MIKLVALILPLGLDTFAVAAALGVAGLPRAQRLRVGLIMAGFEAGMPLLGLALGAPLGHAIGGVADYMAIGILIAFGLFTLLRDEAEREGERVDELTRTQGVAALLLGVSVSLDELAIGFTHRAGEDEGDEDEDRCVTGGPVGAGALRAPERSERGEHHADGVLQGVLGDAR